MAYPRHGRDLEQATEPRRGSECLSVSRSKIIVAFLMAFFPGVVNTVTSLASVDRDTLNLMQSTGVSKLDVLLIFVLAQISFECARPGYRCPHCPKRTVDLKRLASVPGALIGTTR